MERKKKKRKTKHKIKWWMMVLGRMYICRKKGSKQNKKKDFHILKNEVFPFRFTFPIPLSVCVLSVCVCWMAPLMETGPAAILTHVCVLFWEGEVGRVGGRVLDFRVRATAHLILVNRNYHRNTGRLVELGGIVGGEVRRYNTITKIL